MTARDICALWLAGWAASLSLLLDGPGAAALLLAGACASSLVWRWPRTTGATRD